VPAAIDTTLGSSRGVASSTAAIAAAAAAAPTGVSAASTVATTAASAAGASTATASPPSAAAASTSSPSPASQRSIFDMKFNASQHAAATVRDLKDVVRVMSGRVPRQISIVGGPPLVDDDVSLVAAGVGLQCAVQVWFDDATPAAPAAPPVTPATPATPSPAPPAATSRPASLPSSQSQSQSHAHSPSLSLSTPSSPRPSSPASPSSALPPLHTGAPSVRVVPQAALNGVMSRAMSASLLNPVVVLPDRPAAMDSPSLAAAVTADAPPLTSVLPPAARDACTYPLHCAAGTALLAVAVAVSVAVGASVAASVSVSVSVAVSLSVCVVCDIVSPRGASHSTVSWALVLTAARCCGVCPLLQLPVERSHVRSKTTARLSQRRRPHSSRDLRKCML
jgi:hypothetical protein